MKTLLLLLFILLSITASQAQGIIRGKVTDENGEDLIGATVVLKADNSVATITDFEGAYSLKVPPSGSHTIVISYVGHKKTEFPLSIKDNQVIIKNITLQSSSEQIEEAVVIGKANRENDVYMKTIKLKSATSIDYISKETIKKTGDSQVEDAIKRVTGVSTVQGFITVRGLADRYVKTTINGARIPTLDPLTNNIRLDMFPTSLIDNIVITKTQSPDLPGDWTGAYLSIETKSYPQKFMLNVKSSFGYNDQTTFKDVVSSAHSPTEWMGYDDGFRDIDHSKYSEYIGSPKAYDQFVALGLREHLNAMGATDEHVNETPSLENIYVKLGMVELGILPPGQIYDKTAVNEALQQIEDPKSQLYREAFTKMNTPTSEFGKTLPDNWMTTKRQAPLSFSQDITIGNQIMFFGRPLGLLAGIRYSSSTKSDPNAEQLTYSYNRGEKYFKNYTDYQRQYTTETNEWSALLSAAYKITPNHSISLLFMPNMSGENKVRFDSGYSFSMEQEYGYAYTFQHDQHYEERKQFAYQFQSSHYFPVSRLKVKLLGSFTDGSSSTPDYKSFTYASNPDLKDSTGAVLYGYSNGFSPQRRYRYLEEDILDINATGEIPITKKAGFVRKIKFGSSFFNNTRDASQYIYNVYTGGFDNLKVKDPSAPIRQSTFNIVENRAGNLVIYRHYVSQGSDILFNVGHTKISSGFLMADYDLTLKTRICGGLRVEYTDLFNDIKKFHEQGLPRDDPKRLFNSSTGAPPGTKGNKANPTNIYSIDYIPSINLVHKLLTSENVSFNTRLNYSRTIARPSIREVAPFWFFDYEFGTYVIGNPDLRISHIDNFDFRLESYFSSGEFVSASLFYKNFKDHIEMINTNGLYSWSNADKGTAIGIEVEGKKRIVRNLNISANVTIVESNTLVNIYQYDTILSDKVDRAMFGQAPYIINGLIDYTSEALGITVALSYNVQGPKIALASLSDEVPDVYELPMHRLDFKASKSVGNNFSIDFKIRNLLNESTTRAYYYEGSYNDYPFDSYSYGTSYILSISYKI